MHYSDPPIKPDLAFMKELIETMMTYNDRLITYSTHGWGTLLM